MHGPISVHAMSEDEGDDYGSVIDEDEPDELDANNESSKKPPKFMLDDSLGLPMILYLCYEKKYFQ